MIGLFLYLYELIKYTHAHKTAMTDILYPQEPTEQVTQKRKESLVSFCVFFLLKKKKGQYGFFFC